MAVDAIRCVLWSSYDDLREHRCEASPECDDVFARCAEFLEPNRLLLLL